MTNTPDNGAGTMARRNTRSAKGSRTNRPLHEQLYRLRGPEWIDLTVLDQDGNLQKIRLTCPRGLPSTKICISHTPGVRRSKPN